MSLTAPRLVTGEELLALAEMGRCELIDGEIRQLAWCDEMHGRYGMSLAIRVGEFIARHGLGQSYMAGTGFYLKRNPDTVRAPDFAFIRADRVIGDEEGYCHVAPDLIVEVLSPSDKAEDITAKIDQWHKFGVRSAWVVSPKAKTIALHYPDGTGRTFRVGETLTDDLVLPGFQLSVAEVFQ